MNCTGFWPIIILRFLRSYKSVKSNWNHIPTFLDIKIHHFLIENAADISLWKMLTYYQIFFYGCLGETKWYLSWYIQNKWERVMNGQEILRKSDSVDSSGALCFWPIQYEEMCCKKILFKWLCYYFLLTWNGAAGIRLFIREEKRKWLRREAGWGIFPGSMNCAWRGGSVFGYNRFQSGKEW